MSMFRLLVRVSQHLWRQVPLSTLPGGESVTSVLSCYANVPPPRFRVDSESQKQFWRKASREEPEQDSIDPDQLKFTLNLSLELAITYFIVIM